MRLLQRRGWCDHCIRAASPGAAGRLDSPCPWLPQLSLPAGWDVAELEQALALALLQHPLKNFKACFMAGRSGPQPFSLPGDFNEKVIILLIFVDTLCKSCHGSRPAHLSWPGSRGTGTGKAQGTAAATTGQGQAGTRGHGCAQGPTGVLASLQLWPVPCTVGEPGAPKFLFYSSLPVMRFAVSRAVSHQFATSCTFFPYLFPDRTPGILSVLKFHGPLG